MRTLDEVVRVCWLVHQPTPQVVVARLLLLRIADPQALYVYRARPDVLRHELLHVIVRAGPEPLFCRRGPHNEPFLSGKRHRTFALVLDAIRDSCAQNLSALVLHGGAIKTVTECHGALVDVVLGRVDGSPDRSAFRVSEAEFAPEFCYLRVVHFGALLLRRTEL